MRALPEDTAANVLQSAARTSSSEAMLDAASRKISEQDVTALRVLNDHGRCIGILSTMDLEQCEDRDT